jgi:hypothetical protein
MNAGRAGDRPARSFFLHGALPNARGCQPIGIPLGSPTCGMHNSTIVWLRPVDRRRIDSLRPEVSMRGIRLASLALALALLLLLACSDWNDIPPVPPSGTAEIYGAVIGGSGPIERAWVRVASVDRDATFDSRSAEDGTFLIPVPPGSYRLAITPPDAIQSQIWFAAEGPTLDGSLADTIRVQEGGGDFRADFLLGGVLLYVHVTPLSDEREISCALVDPDEPASYSSGHRSWIDDSLAVFDFPAVVPGEYLLKVRRWDSELWLPPTVDRSRAGRIEIEPLQTLFRSDTLPNPARIRGRLSGAWISGGITSRISLHGPDSTIVSSGYQAEDGSFALAVPAGGTIRVSAESGSGDWESSRVRTWLGGASLGTATPFLVEPGASIDVGDFPTCGIRCRIADPPGGPPDDWHVGCYDTNERLRAGVISSGSGEAVVPLSGPGEFRLLIRRVSNGSWRQQWFDRQVRFEDATPVAVTDPGATAEASFVLEKGGTISGKILDLGGAPIEDLVGRIEVGDRFEDHFWGSGEDGSFAVTGLPDGDMILSVRTRFAWVYYPGTTDRDSAQAIPIANAASVGGIEMRIRVVRPEDFHYVGAGLCKPCHQSEAQGRIYGIWAASAHARAYEDLGSYERQDGVCLACHTTGYGRTVAQGRDRDDLLGVQCEACHGPGSEYKPMSVMQDRALAAYLGLLNPNEETCRKCHRGALPQECWGGSGSSPRFDFSEGLGLIAHQIPG